MHKIQLSDIEKKLIKDSTKTSVLLITILSILQWRNHPDNGGSQRDLDTLNQELNDLARYIEAQQKFEDQTSFSRPCIVNQVQDMTCRIQLPKKVATLFERTGFDTTIELRTDGDYDEQGGYLINRFENFKIQAGIDIRLVPEETPE
jgi:hypothetical protein